MSSYGCSAWIDMLPGSDPEPVLELIRSRRPAEAPDQELLATVVGDRIELYMHFGNYRLVADLAVAAMRETGIVRRMFIVLDHDEFGCEYAVVGGGTVLLQVVRWPRTWYGLPDRGEPWNSGLPAGVRSRGSTFWGRLIDGPEAWDATAELYGVDPLAVERGVYGGRTAERPYWPVMEALGIDDLTGRRSRLWPGPIWRDAAIRYAVPRLTGSWHVDDQGLIMLPVGPVACGLEHGQYGLHVMMVPLYLPKHEAFIDMWEMANECQVTGAWQQFGTMAAGESYMERLVTVVSEQVAPFFAQYGTLDGYAELLRARTTAGARGIGHARHLCELGATELLRGRFADAETELDRAVSAAREDWGPGHPLERYALAMRRALADDPAAARDTLLANIPHRRRRLGLPGAD